VDSLAFSPDGTLLASGSHNTTIRMWRVNNGKGVHMLTGHQREVKSLAFSPDGALMAPGPGDGTVRL